MYKKVILFSLLFYCQVPAIGQPKLKLDSLHYNLKPAIIESITTYKIFFKNIGNRPLIIMKAQSPTSNAVIDYPKEPVLPNTNGYFIINIHNGHLGDFKYHFNFSTNECMKEDILLIVYIKVIATFISEKND